MVRFTVASPGGPAVATNSPFSMWSTMDFGRLNSPAEVMYFTLSPSSSAVSAAIRRPFLSTMVSAAAPAVRNRSTAPSRKQRILGKTAFGAILLFYFLPAVLGVQTLFLHAESDYTSRMRVEARVFVLCCFLAPVASPATEQSPHELYDAINALTVDPSTVYHLVPANRIELRKGDAVISLEEGTLAFYSPFEGRVTGAVFSGRGHVVAAPRDPVEKQQMGRFLGAPLLDQVFVNAYFRFTDETAGELLSQFRKANLAPQTDQSFAAQWEPTLARINPIYALRILIDFLSPDPRPYFYAGVDGA